MPIRPTHRNRRPRRQPAAGAPVFTLPAAGLLENCSGPKRYATVQVDVTDPGVLAALTALHTTLPVADVLENETDPHVTVRWGLHDAADLGAEGEARARTILDHEPAVTYALGNLSVFTGGANGDVLKLTVLSPDLERLNRKLGLLPNTQTFPYSPHLTVAYMKPGTADKFAGPAAGLTGRRLTAAALTYKPSDAAKANGAKAVSIPLAAVETRPAVVLPLPTPTTTPPPAPVGPLPVSNWGYPGTGTKPPGLAEAGALDRLDALLPVINARRSVKYPPPPMGEGFEPTAHQLAEHQAMAEIMGERAHWSHGNGSWVGSPTNKPDPYELADRANFYWPPGGTNRKRRVEKLKKYAEERGHEVSEKPGMSTVVTVHKKPAAERDEMTLKAEKASREAGAFRISRQSHLKQAADLHRAAAFAHAAARDKAEEPGAERPDDAAYHKSQIERHSTAARQLDPEGGGATVNSDEKINLPWGETARLAELGTAPGSRDDRPHLYPDRYPTGRIGRTPTEQKAMAVADERAHGELRTLIPGTNPYSSVDLGYPAGENPNRLSVIAYTSARLPDITTHLAAAGYDPPTPSEYEPDTHTFRHPNTGTTINVRPDAAGTGGWSHVTYHPRYGPDHPDDTSRAAEAWSVKAAAHTPGRGGTPEQHKVAADMHRRAATQHAIAWDKAYEEGREADMASHKVANRWHSHVAARLDPEGGGATVTVNRRKRPLHTTTVNADPYADRTTVPTRRSPAADAYRGWITPEGGHIPAPGYGHLKALRAATGLDVDDNGHAHRLGYARVDADDDVLHVDTHVNHLAAARQWVRKTVDPHLVSSVAYTTFGHPDGRPRFREEDLTGNADPTTASPPTEPTQQEPPTQSPPHLSPAHAARVRKVTADAAAIPAAGPGAWEHHTAPPFPVSTYTFSTSAGTPYLVTAAESARKGPKPAVTYVNFRPTAGNHEDPFGVTGGGHAHEVFAKVVPAVVRLIHDKSPPVVHFTAHEPSRVRLYDRLARTAVAALPGHRAARLDIGGVSHYVLVKPRPGDANPDAHLHETVAGFRKWAGAPRSEATVLNAVSGVTVGILTPAADPAWWEEEKPFAGNAVVSVPPDAPEYHALRAKELRLGREKNARYVGKVRSSPDAWLADRIVGHLTEKGPHNRRQLQNALALDADALDRGIAAAGKRVRSEVRPGKADGGGRPGTWYSAAPEEKSAAVANADPVTRRSTGTYLSWGKTAAMTEPGYRHAPNEVNLAYRPGAFRTPGGMYGRGSPYRPDAGRAEHQEALAAEDERMHGEVNSVVPGFSTSDFYGDYITHPWIRGATVTGITSLRESLKAAGYARSRTAIGDDLEFTHPEGHRIILGARQSARYGRHVEYHPNWKPDATDDTSRTADAASLTAHIATGKAEGVPDHMRTFAAARHADAALWHGVARDKADQEGRTKDAERHTRAIKYHAAVSKRMGGQPLVENVDQVTPDPAADLRRDATSLRELKALAEAGDAVGLAAHPALGSPAVRVFKAAALAGLTGPRTAPESMLPHHGHGGTGVGPGTTAAQPSEGAHLNEPRADNPSGPTPAAVRPGYKPLVHAPGTPEGEQIKAEVRHAAAEFPKADLTEYPEYHHHDDPRNPEYRGSVGGLSVRTHIPNVESIGATYEDWHSTELPGIRAVPIEALGPLHPYASADDNRRVDHLTEQIRESRSVNPLIVVSDHKHRLTGYADVLEGGHRARALKKLGVTHVPAAVVVDHSESNPT